MSNMFYFITEEILRNHKLLRLSFSVALNSGNSPAMMGRKLLIRILPIYVAFPCRLTSVLFPGQ